MAAMDDLYASLLHTECAQIDDPDVAKQAAISKRDRRWWSFIGDLCRGNPRLFWSEKKVSIRNRFAYKRHASSAVSILLTKDKGS
jgi:hypothetical protein